MSKQRALSDRTAQFKILVPGTWVKVEFMPWRKGKKFDSPREDGWQLDTRDSMPGSIGSPRMLCLCTLSIDKHDRRSCEMTMTSRGGGQVEFRSEDGCHNSSESDSNGL
jgi:hypothetical protein